MSHPHHSIQLYSNGATENAVRSFKNGLKKALIDKNNVGLSKKLLISRYLMHYRCKPHSNTGQTPAIVYCISRDETARLRTR